MKVLVTGAAGFVGHNMVLHLLSKNHEVVGLDNLSTFSDVELKILRLKNAGISYSENNCEYKSSHYPAYKFVKADIQDAKVLTELLENEKFDVICHFAALTGVRKSRENALDYIRTNADGFACLLEVAKKIKVKRIIYASSSSVYGLNQNIPFSVNDSTDKQISVYAATKKMSELLAHTYSYQYKMPITGFRFFTIYGPWGRPDMAVNIFTKKILNHQPIEVFGNGNNLRDYTYIGDVVSILEEYLTMCSNDDETKEKNSCDDAPCMIYNLGSSKPSSLNQLIKVIEDHSGIKAEIRYLPEKPEDVPNTYADISGLPAYLKNKPDTSLADGMKIYLDWYIQNSKI